MINYFIKLVTNICICYIFIVIVWHIIYCSTTINFQNKLFYVFVYTNTVWDINQLSQFAITFKQFRKTFKNFQKFENPFKKVYKFKSKEIKQNSFIIYMKQFYYADMANYLYYIWENYVKKPFHKELEKIINKYKRVRLCIELKAKSNLAKYQK